MHNKILYYGLAFGRQHTLGVELNAVDVIVLVVQSHYLAFVAYGSHLKAGGEVFAAHHPRVVASHGNALGQSVEYVVVGELRALGGYSVEHVAKVFERAAEYFAYGLMAKAYAQYGLVAGVSLDDVEQKSCF